MEDLLTPQICMDVDDTPLEVGRDDASEGETSETSEPEVDDDEKVKILLETEFTDPAQVPDDLTEFEKEARKNVFAIGEPAVQFQRLHCTACNVHLGSAPIGHFNRFIHPLLKVLLCKACYEFYRSGEFDKDEDGSEMYCRWCGQGGKVMCCAQCAYVFCQKCVRQNLGRKTLELIKDSDDWMCFGCSPTQLINIKIICTSLFEFVQEEIRLAKALNNAERLKIDHSVCCQKLKTQTKRKRDDDGLYNPTAEWDEQIKASKKSSSSTIATSILKHTLTQPPLIEETRVMAAPQTSGWSAQDEDEVVCTPDLASLMEEEDKQTSTPPPLSFHVPVIQQAQNKVGFGSPCVVDKATGSKLAANRFNMPLLQRLGKPDGVGKKLYAIAPKVTGQKPPIVFSTFNNRPLLANNVQQGLKPSSNFVRLQSPAIKFVAHPVTNKGQLPAPVVNASPAQFVPGLRHEWFEKAATIVSTITGNLSTSLVGLTKEQKGAKTVEQLATVHNKLQELLSTSVNSLIQVRKNLRNEFLNDLNKLKFKDPNGSYNNTNNNKGGGNKNNGKTNAVTNNNNNNNNRNVVDDDDVIIVNSVESCAKKSGLIGERNAAGVGQDKQPRTYLKVRSVSQLLSVPSECITIPDDPPPPTQNDDVIAVVETDPLSFEQEDEVLPPTSVAEDEAKDDADATQIKEMSYCDQETHLMIKNALAESKIDLLVEANSKYVIDDVPEDELRKVLSVRVVLATKYRHDLPKRRLKTADWFNEDIEAILGGNILIKHATAARWPEEEQPVAENHESKREESVERDSNTKISETEECETHAQGDVEEGDPCMDKVDEPDSSGGNKEKAGKGDQGDADELLSARESHLEHNNSGGVSVNDLDDSVKSDVNSSVDPVTTDSGIDVDGGK